MHTNVGLWIDHRNAVIVTLQGGAETRAQIDSGVERQLRRTGDSPLKGAHEPQHVPADDSRQRAFTGHLNAYYDRVIAALQEADSILIFGPGEAKEELKARLDDHPVRGQIVGVEAADRLTDPQIAAKVREHFIH